LYKNI